MANLYRSLPKRKPASHASRPPPVKKGRRPRRQIPGPRLQIGFKWLGQAPKEVRCDGHRIPLWARPAGRRPCSLAMARPQTHRAPVDVRIADLPEVGPCRLARRRQRRTDLRIDRRRFLPSETVTAQIVTRRPVLPIVLLFARGKATPLDVNKPGGVAMKSRR